MEMTIVVLLSLCSLAVGAVISWLVAKVGNSRAQETLRSELTRQLNDVSLDRSQLQERAARIPELQSHIASLEESRNELMRETGVLRESVGKTVAELTMERSAATIAREELQQALSDRERMAGELSRASIQLAELTMQLDGERRQSDEKLALLKEARESLGAQFQNLANEILEEKSKRFAEQNQANIGLLLDPLRTKLTEFQAKVETVYDNETRDRTALGEQVRQLVALNQSLSQDARNLTSALKGSSKTQGNWGELVLERVLESSGLRKGEEYDVQESHANETGGRSQPDVTIHLPEDRHLVIDSKVSLNAYEEFATTEDEDDRQRALKRHLDSVRAHMRGLSEKNYQDLYGLKSLDFVLMFVPIEPAFMLAVTHDRNLFMDGWQRNVLLVSPSTLLFVVRTVAHLWRQEAQHRNAQDIAKRGAELYDRLCAFVVDLEKIGERIGLAQDSFNSARDKLSKNKGNVIRQAEMLKAMGVKPNKALPARLVDAASDDDSLLVQTSGSEEQTTLPVLTRRSEVPAKDDGRSQVER